MASIEGLKEYVKAHEPWDGYLDWTDLAAQYQKLHYMQFDTKELMQAFHDYWANHPFDEEKRAHCGAVSVEQKMKESYWLSMILASYDIEHARKLANKAYADGHLTKEDFEIFA